MPTDTQDKTVYEKSARFAQSVFQDFSSGDLPQSLRQDLRETYDFYLDEETRNELAGMSPVKRWFVSSWRLVKSLFLKLTPTRRLILLVGLVLAASGWGGSGGGDSGNLLLGFLALLFILGLELKDKLLARNELEAGRAVQSALMPERRPVFEGWDFWLYTSPASEVGGDLVDCQAIDDDRFAVSLGDVSGKGLGAALFMAKLQATLRAIAPSIRSLAELGTRVNDIFCRDGVPGRFASLVYAEVGRSEGTVRVMNAGHMPPTIVRSDGTTSLGKGGQAIGLASGARYAETDVNLETGDLLVLFSDGVTEARDVHGAFFGDDRLARLLKASHGRPAPEVGENIVVAVEQFVGSAPPSDDLSVVVLARRPRPALPPAGDRIA